MKTGTEAYASVDNTSVDNALEAWRRLVQHFDAASARDHITLLSNV